MFPSCSQSCVWMKNFCIACRNIYVEASQCIDQRTSSLPGIRGKLSVVLILCLARLAVRCLQTAAGVMLNWMRVFLASPSHMARSRPPRLWASRAGLWFTGSDCSRSDTGTGCRLGCGMKSYSDLFLVLEENKLCAYIITLHMLIQPGISDSCLTPAHISSDTRYEEVHEAEQTITRIQACFGEADLQNILVSSAIHFHQQ